MTTRMFPDDFQDTGFGFYNFSCQNCKKFRAVVSMPGLQSILLSAIEKARSTFQYNYNPNWVSHCFSASQKNSFIQQDNFVYLGNPCVIAGKK